MPVYKSKEVTKDGRKWFFKCQYKDAYGETHTKKSKKYELKTQAEEAEREFYEVVVKRFLIKLFGMI